MSTTKPDEKILSDLSTLNEQISLAQSMLVNAGPLSSITNDTNEALLTVIGFLEACVPRMMELIEAAASGALKPEVSLRESFLCYVSCCSSPMYINLH